MREHSEISKSERFNWLLIGKKQGPDPCFDQDLSDDNNFAVLPTKGSLVSGWLLIIPKIKVLSLAELPLSAQKSILQMGSAIAGKVSGLGKSVFMFEHGPSRKKSLIGCGVDQAHLHVVPLEFDLLSLCLNANDGIKWHEVDVENPWLGHDRDKSYYLISDMQKAFIGHPEEERSQYFRKKIAEQLGRDEEWDYKSYPHNENALRTVKHFVGQK